jgi:hypothetical protein
MDEKRTLYWSTLHAVAWLVGALVAVALVGVGYRYLGIDVAWDNYRAGESTFRTAARTAAPGVVVAALGIAVWRAVASWALFRTLVPATRDALSETYDTERVKSEVLTVLDERLSEMQQDIQSVERAARSSGEETDFELD